MEVRQIKNIQDDINDYIDNCQEPEFIENDYIYDDIDGLEEMLIDVSITYVSFFSYCKIWSDSQKCLWILGGCVERNHNKLSIIYSKGLIIRSMQCSTFVDDTLNGRNDLAKAPWLRNEKSWFFNLFQIWSTAINFFFLLSWVQGARLS